MPISRAPSQALLAQALPLVRKFGWEQSLVEVFRKHKLSDQGTGLFAPGDLISYYYTQETAKLAKLKPQSELGFERLRELFKHRLSANSEIGPERLGEAIRLSAGLQGLKLLSETSDELCYLAGDRSTDTQWYIRRGAVLGAYAACEAFQSRDHSSSFRQTHALADKLLESLSTADYAEQSIAEWGAYQLRAIGNIARTFR